MKKLKSSAKWRDVACPMCKALPGDRCKGTFGGEITSHVHISRRRLSEFAAEKSVRK